MPTIGRPITLPTIIKRLRYLRDSPFFDVTPVDRILDDMANYLATDLTKVSAKSLHNMVNDLQRVLDDADQDGVLETSDRKMLVSCIDGLARLEAVKLTTKAPTEVTAMRKLNRLLDAEEAKAKVIFTKGEMTARNRALSAVAVSNDIRRPASTTEAIAGAIHVLVDEVVNNDHDNDTFDALRHLINVLERLN